MYSVKFYDIMCMSLFSGKALHTTAGGSAPLPEGGETHADYFDVPCLWTYVHDSDQKVKPPPLPR